MAKHFELMVKGYIKLLCSEFSETVDASNRLKRYENGSKDTSDFVGSCNDGDDNSDSAGENDINGNSNGDN